MFSSTRSSFNRTSPATASFKSQFTVRPIPAGLDGQALQSYVTLTLNKVPFVSSCTPFITSVKRLGSFEYPSTAVITCTDPTTRNVFLSNKKRIQTETGFISDAYLSLQQQHRREAMAHYYTLLKQRGYKPHWRVDRLCYMRDGKSATFSPFSIFGQRLLAGLFAKPRPTSSTEPPSHHAPTTTQGAPPHHQPPPQRPPAPPPPPPPPPPPHMQATDQPAQPQLATAPIIHQPAHPQPAPVREDNTPTTAPPTHFSAQATTKPPSPQEEETLETPQDSLSSWQTATHVSHDSYPSSPSTAAPLSEATTTIHITGQLLGLKHAILSYKNNPYRITGLPDEDVAPLQQSCSMCLDAISQASQFHPYIDSTDLQQQATDCIDDLLQWADHLESHKDIDHDAAIGFRMVVVEPFTKIFEQFISSY